MMFLSMLLIDVGSNPDRPRPGRLWLRNLYRVHQRLCMAFPSASRASDDTDFLKPFQPQDFACQQVHVIRGPDTGFLFRVDPQPGGRAVILVQSAMEPDWDYAFKNAGYLLAACPEKKSFAPCFKEGRLLKFRLLANPTRKVDTKSGPDGQRRNGRRVPVPAGEFYEWLAHRAEKAGFRLAKESTIILPGYVYVNKQGGGQRYRSVQYDGCLTVTDSALFQETLAHGIGPGKAFGFGLLSVAPAGL